MSVMKKIVVLVVLALALQFSLPVVSDAWYRPYPYPYRYGWGPYYGGGYYYGGYSGWDVAGAVIGGALLGVAVTSLIVQASRPTTVVTQGPVYATPPPLVPNQAYAYPDPAFIEQHQPGKTPGEWVTVPGQWVGGTWVPEHRVLVPSSP
jgi:hypothetical protein